MKTQPVYDIIATTEWYPPNSPAHWLQLIQGFIGNGMLEATGMVMSQVFRADSDYAERIGGTVSVLLDDLKTMAGDWWVEFEAGWGEPVVQLAVVKSDSCPNCLLVISEPGLGEYDEEDQ